MKRDSSFIGIGNAKLYYEIAGDGQPLVFIHAGVADSRQWNNEFVCFAQAYRVLRYDMRGYGKSLPVDGEYSHLEDLIGLLDELELNKPLVLIGCSMGGSLAMDFALEHPSRLKALVMVGSSPSGLWLDVPDHPNEREAEEAYKAGELEKVAELEAKIWFEGMGRTAQQVNQTMRKLALEMNRLALSHEARQLGKRLPNTDTPAAERLNEIKIPVLVVIGENDIPYCQKSADYMTENIPNARKETLEDAAHLANMDHPDRFRIILETFLDEVN